MLEVQHLDWLARCQYTVTWFVLSVAERQIVLADQSLRCTLHIARMLHNQETNKEQRRAKFVFWGENREIDCMYCEILLYLFPQQPISIT